MSDPGRAITHRNYTHKRPIEPKHAAAVPGAADLEAVRKFQRSASSAQTRRGYAIDWNSFTTWCQSQGLQALPADPITVARYLAFGAELVKDAGGPFYAAATIVRWLAAINKAHLVAGYPKPGNDPRVELTIAGIRRELAKPQAKKKPLLLNQLRRAILAIDLNTYPAGVIGHRDWAILLFGFAGAYRRSELASLLLKDVTPHPEDGLHVLLRQSKTDQEGEGLVKGLPFGSNPVTCTPCAFARWVRVLAAAGQGRTTLLRVLLDSTTAVHICKQPLPELDQLDMELPLFRPVMKNAAIKNRPISGNVVNDVVKRRIQAVGIRPAAYGAHSLRAGFVTQAFRAGATHHEVMRQTGHKNVETVEEYARDNDPLRDSAVTRIGL